VPAAFTATTGRAHWLTLLRARAIENLCYVLAPAQGGNHLNGRATFGHSVLFDPWGETIAQIDQGPGVIVGDVDLERMARVRASLPALAHRVFA
jgi:nitrilase